MDNSELLVFRLHSAREAINFGLTHIEEQVKALEQAIAENPGLVFDLSKTIVESTCKSILKERNIEFSKEDDLPKLFKVVTNYLPFLPSELSTDSEARKSLRQTLNGLSTSLQGVCELRNSYGFASHGQDGAREGMETIQALLAAQTADAMVGFLYRIHADDLSKPHKKRIEYSENPVFNNWIDDSNSVVEICSLIYSPSEVLYTVDKPAYDELLGFYQTELMAMSEDKNKDSE
jgi:hypothetical protein